MQQPIASCARVESLTIPALVLPTCTAAGPDLCTMHPKLCTLCLGCLSPAATYGGGVSPSADGTNTPLAHVAVSPIATCASGVFLPPTGVDTVLTLKQLALCSGGICMYKITNMKPYETNF